MLTQQALRTRPNFYKAGNIIRGIAGAADFSSGWTSTNCSTTVNGGVKPPAGGSDPRSARLLEDATAGVGHVLSYDGTSMAVVAGQKYHAGIFYRRVTNSSNVRNIQIKIFDSTYGDSCYNNTLYTGLTGGSNAGSTLITQSALRTQPVGDGWILSEQTIATVSATNIKFYVSLLDSGFGTTFNGDGVSGYDIWNPYLVLVGA